ncbi:OmpH family outer membrane protein [Sneathiella marina]|uniref:OmpH family outer membrane protein n=1 Tax=Sneathiella marina TaxID=2950108 RepID=A0ABY4VYA9_9PROT|nr:OmpH family outer membrane protein [Sneathiella marina]USG59611.1 OmpH family outer membrane protein [Sneathiella marina]
MKAKIVRLFLFSAIMSIFFVQYASSQSTRNDVIGIIDIRLIMQKLSVVQDINVQVKSLEEKIKAEFKERESKLKTEKDQIERQKVLVTPKIYAQKQKEFNLKAKGFRREIDEKSRRLQQARAIALTDVRESMIPLAQVIMNKYGATVVFDQNEILFADQSLDLTPEVIEELNKKLSKVVVKMLPLKKS